MSHMTKTRVIKTANEKQTESDAGKREEPTGGSF